MTNTTILSYRRKLCSGRPECQINFNLMVKYKTKSVMRWHDIWLSICCSICWLNLIIAIKNIKQIFDCVCQYFCLVDLKRIFKIIQDIELYYLDNIVLSDPSSKQKVITWIANYNLRLTRSWYFRYGSLTNQFLRFQKDVVILSRSLLCVLLQNTWSLRRFRLAGCFFHSFFLYPACWQEKQEVRLGRL